MESLSAELTLHIVQYLNVRDSGRLAQQSRRCYYLVHQYRRLRQQHSPDVGSAASIEPLDGGRRLCHMAASQMQLPPRLAIAFHHTLNPGRESVDHRCLDQCLPKDAVVLGVYSRSEIQTIHCGVDPNRPKVDCQNRSSILMIGGIPANSVEPFSFRPNDDIDACIRGLQAKNPSWKAFLLFVGDNYAGNIEEGFLQPLQSSFRNALIIGGLGAAMSYVPTDADRMRHDAALLQRTGPLILAAAVLNFMGAQSRFFVPEPDTVCGVALSNDVPIQGIVSRGMKSYIRPSPPPLDRPSPIRVGTMGDVLGTPTILSFVEDIDVTRRELTCPRFLAKYGRQPLLGLRRESDDGFHVGSLRLVENMIILDDFATDGPTFAGAEVELFQMTRDSLKEDVVQSMAWLRDQTRGRKILGAVMVSCNGRGPHSGGVMGEEMYDAHCFGKAFPSVPCLGFYANGEIGPQARVGRANLFRTGDAAVQGFTAVFGLFIVPDQVGRLDTTTLLDSSEAISSFIDERLNH